MGPLGMLLTSASLSMGGAQETQSPTMSYDTDAAARCAVAYAFTVDAMQSATGIPQDIRRSMRDGLAVWEYELAASAPGAGDQVLKDAANRAVAYVRAGMPNENTPESATARGDYLLGITKSCRMMVSQVYGDVEHPVIPFLRQADAGTVVPPAAMPKPMPVNAAAAEPTQPAARRGLR